MQQLHSVIDEVNEDFKTQDDRLDGKIDALIALQKERLELERERLAFEHEKAGLPARTQTEWLVYIPDNVTQYFPFG